LDSHRLALGTVQFGIPYGIANRTGQVQVDDAAAIIRRAFAAGINTLDTAIAYGESESRLGSIGVGEWRVITKLPPLPEGCTDVSGWARESVMRSLDRLGITHLRALLLHDSQQLLGPRGAALHAALVALKDGRLVEQIGVSIYGPEELDALFATFQLDLVQAPFNVVDRRLATSGWLTRMHQAGTEVHVRSVFLQGLLLMDAGKRPDMFSRWQPQWDRWHSWLERQALTPLQACLGFVGSRPEIGRVIVGVDSLWHLEEILSAINVRAIEPPGDLAIENRDLVDPSRWKRQ
jgi:aryl-alcohol dehydrogenase-like predicted oxidoreductase